MTLNGIAELVWKANARMELVRKVASFGASVEDLKTIYILFVRSLLEQSATVWHSSLTMENSDDIERVQKITTSMFPLNKKTHEMQTWNPDKCEVQHAHNERLKNSAIIYMQNLLNPYQDNLPDTHDES